MRHSTVRGQTGPGRGRRRCWRRPASAQTAPAPALPSRCPPPAPRPSQSSAPVRRLSVDEAVKLAFEQNLGIQVERFNPQIQDLEHRPDARLVGADPDRQHHQHVRPTTRPPARFRAARTG